MDLYAILEITRYATKQDIRNSYRRLAKSCHPDKGGEREEWDKITLAHDILSDEARRAKYDATGDIDSNKPDNDRAKCIVRVTAAVMNGIQVAREKSQKTVGRSPFTYDILALAKAQLQDHLKRVNVQLEDYESRKEFMTQAAGRFKKDGGDEDVIAQIFAADMRGMEQSIEACQEEIRLTHESLKLFEGYSFEAERPEYDDIGEVLRRAMDMKREQMLLQAFLGNTPTARSTQAHGAPE